MIRWLICPMILFSVLNSWGRALTAEQKVLKEIKLKALRYNSNPSFTNFFREFGQGLNEEDIVYLNKMSRLKSLKQLPKVQVKGRNVRINNHDLEILSLEQRVFKLNGYKFQLNKGRKLEDKFSYVSRILRKTKTSSWIQLFLREAWAYTIENEEVAAIGGMLSWVTLRGHSGSFHKALNEMEKGSKLNHSVLGFTCESKGYNLSMANTHSMVHYSVAQKNQAMDSSNLGHFDVDRLQNILGGRAMPDASFVVVERIETETLRLDVYYNYDPNEGTYTKIDEQVCFKHADTHKQCINRADFPSRDEISRILSDRSKTHTKKKCEENPKAFNVSRFDLDMGFHYKCFDSLYNRLLDDYEKAADIQNRSGINASGSKDMLQSGLDCCSEKSVQDREVCEGEIAKINIDKAIKPPKGMGKARGIN